MIFFFCVIIGTDLGDIMKKLIDYDVLVNDVFYRSEHVLDYIIRHKNISELD